MKAFPTKRRRTRCSLDENLTHRWTNWAPTLDKSPFGPGLERTVAERKYKTRENTRNPRATASDQKSSPKYDNPGIKRTSPGAKAKVGGKVQIKESTEVPHRDGVRAKLSHYRFTRSWQVMNVVKKGLRFTVRLNGSQLRQRTASTTGMNPFHSRPPELQHGFEDEHSHLVWSADLGLVEIPVAAVPLYTLANGGVVQGVEGAPTTWA